MGEEVSTEQLDQEKEYVYVDTDQILYGDRYRKDMGDVEGLCKSIETVGQLTPVIVMRTAKGSDHEYLLLDGGRRYLACRMLKRKTWAVVHNILDELAIRKIEHAANVCRKAFDIREEALLTKRIHDLGVEKYGEALGGPGGGHRIEDTAKLMGVSRQKAAESLEIAEALEEDPKLFREKGETKKDVMSRIRRKEADTKNKEIAEEARIIADKAKHKTVTARLAEAYIVGDFFEGIEKYDPASFHFAEVDPPYGVNLLENKKSQDPTHMEEYNEISEEDYPEFITRVIKETKRVLVPDGWIVVWFGEPFRKFILDTLREHDFIVPDVAGVWDKLGAPGQAWSPHLTLGSCYESFFFGRLPGGKLHWWGERNLIELPPISEKKKTHPTAKPIYIYEWFAKLFCPPQGRILVPFLGSGNTILGAHNAGRNAVGFDLSQIYRDRFVVYLQEHEGTRQFPTYPDKAYFFNRFERASLLLGGKIWP